MKATLMLTGLTVLMLAASPALAGGDPEHGAELAADCAMCHGDAGEGDGGDSDEGESFHGGLLPSAHRRTRSI